MAIFTPDDEPYLGLEAVLHFDQVIVSAMEQQVSVAKWTHSNSLSPLQEAAAEIVPGACSIALSIRELVRQGYLFSALILLRPLVERAGVLSYLADNPAALSLWQQGWPYKSRPKLPALLAAMRGTPSGIDADTASAEAKLIADLFNALVHGDPISAHETLVSLPDGRPGFTTGKDLASPGRADLICHLATAYLIVLMGRTAQLFPEAKSRQNGRSSGKVDV